jgi:membrane protein insertase Oxa1/YidC/SpoIIIJ
MYLTRYSNGVGVDLPTNERVRTSMKLVSTVGVGVGAAGVENGTNITIAGNNNETTVSSNLNSEEAPQSVDISSGDVIGDLDGFICPDNPIGIIATGVTVIQWVTELPWWGAIIVFTLVYRLFFFCIVYTTNKE